VFAQRRSSLVTKTLWRLLSSPTVPPLRPCPSCLQVAASAGVKLSEADAALKALAYDSLGNLEVCVPKLSPQLASRHS